MRAMQPVVLVTGASSGLGLAIARSLLARNYRLVLTARESSLPRFAKAGIHESERVRLRALDVINAEHRKAVIKETDDDWGGVDVLINNAGVSYRSVVEHVTDADRLAQMEINFRAPMELTRLVLPRMRKKCGGRVINISSVGGMMAMPTMSVYSASKFALEGASEALWYEVRPWGIHVSLVEPGFINSDGFEHVRFTELSQEGHDTLNSAYYWHYHHMEGFIGKVMRRVHATPESVARTVVHTIERKNPPLRVAGTFDARFFSLMRRVMPRRLYHWFLYLSLPNVNSWGPKRPKLPEVSE